MTSSQQNFTKHDKVFIDDFLVVTTGSINKPEPRFSRIQLYSQRHDLTFNHVSSVLS